MNYPYLDAMRSRFAMVPEISNDKTAVSSTLFKNSLIAAIKKNKFAAQDRILPNVREMNVAEEHIGNFLRNLVKLNTNSRGSIAPTPNTQKTLTLLRQLHKIGSPVWTEAFETLEQRNRSRLMLLRNTAKFNII